MIGEDGSRAALDYLTEPMGVSRDAGAERFLYAESTVPRPADD